MCEYTFLDVLQTCDNGMCDCQLYLKEKGYYGNESFPVVNTTTTPVPLSTTPSPFDVVNDDGTSVLGQADPSTMHNSCGLQLYAGTFGQQNIYCYIVYIKIEFNTNFALLFFQPTLHRMPVDT